MTNQPQHDEWIFGNGTDQVREYVIHTREPRFIAEVVGEDDPVGILDPFTYAGRAGENYARFVWYDDPPTGEALHDLLRRMDEAMDANTLQARADLHRRDLTDENHA